MAITHPRVLNLAGGGPRRLALDIVASPITEFLVSLQTFQFEEAVHTFDVGVDWFDRVRTDASSELIEALTRLGPVGWGSLLGKALAEGWPPDVPGVIDRVEAAGDEELWLLLAGSQVRPFAEHVQPETFRRAAAGEPEARAHLTRMAWELFGEKEPESGLWSLAADDVHRLMITALRGWYRDVFAPTERETTAVLERDAEAKRRFRRTATDESLVETATNGIVYVPEPWVRRVVLTPHAAMRPWNVQCAFDDVYVLCYPVADESLGIDRAAPPARLLRLHKALADEKRLRILKLLASSELTLQEIANRVGLAKSTAHHHTVILRAAGLIRTSTQLENRYSLRRESFHDAGASLAEFLEGDAS